jgi:hypothetical protein
MHKNNINEFCLECGFVEDSKYSFDILVDILL